jgi:hypothetical protein
MLHVVSEKKIFEISANQRLLWTLAAMLDDRSEQKVTTIDQDLVRNISAKYGSKIENPRWLPTAGHSLMYDPMGNMIKKNSQELLKGLLKPYLAEMFLTRS